MRTAAFISILIFIAFSSALKAQNETFEELFKIAYECDDCSNSLKVELFTNVIDHGVSDIEDLDNFQNALVNRATILIEMNKYKEAIEDLNLAFSVKSDYSILQKLGTAYLGNTQYQEALQQFNTYLEHVESDKKISLMRYVSTQSGKDESFTQEKLDEMREISEKEWNLKLKTGYNNRGITKGFLNDHKGACADFHKAYEAGMIELKSFIAENCD